MKDKSPFKVGKKERRSRLSKYEAILEKELVQTGGGKMTRIFASSAGQCERQIAGLYYLPDGYKRVRKASAEFYFSVGSLYEKIVSKALHKAELFVDAETRVEAYHEDIPLSGRIDFTIKDPEDLDSLILVELKSCGKLPERPRHGHLAQLMTYLTVTGMPKGVIWYISRSVAGWGGDLLQRSFEIEPDWEEKWNSIFTTAFGAVHAREGLLPPLPPTMKKYKCGFCPLIPFCWDGDASIIGGYAEPTPEQVGELWDEASAIADDFIEHQDDLKEKYYELMLSSD